MARLREIRVVQHREPIEAGWWYVSDDGEQVSPFYQRQGNAEAYGLRRAVAASGRSNKPVLFVSTGDGLGAFVIGPGQYPQGDETDGSTTWGAW